MGKRGPKPKGKVRIRFSPNFAYAIGLLVTDGSLSKNGRHITLTSKDKEQLNNFMTALGIKVKIGIIHNVNNKTAFRVQFGDVLFYKYLESLGISKVKSLTIKEVSIPDKYFFDFMRGCFDGDGSSHSYWDPRWRSSFMFYMSLASGSKDFIEWIQKKVLDKLGIKGYIGKTQRINPYYQLKYSKHEAIKLVRQIYKRRGAISLSRKKLKINKSLSTMGVNLVD